MVPGMLRRWVRDCDDRWFGLVDFAALGVAGEVCLHLRGVLVPAAALAPIPDQLRR